MPPEEEILTNEQTASDLEEDAGFNNDTEATLTQTPAMHTEESKETPAEPEPEVHAPKYAQITEEDYAALQAKAAQVEEFKGKFDTVFGHIGAMKQKLEGSSKRPFLDVEKLKAGKMAASLGEEFGAEFAADLAEAIGETDAFDPSPFKAEVESRINEVFSQFQQRQVATELKLLSALQPGWKATVYADPVKQDAFTPEFQKFFDGLPEADQKAMTSAADFDAELSAERIGEFKKLQAPAPSTVAPKATDKPASNPRTERMKAAVAPRGTGNPAGKALVTEDDGFNSV